MIGQAPLDALRTARQAWMRAGVRGVPYLLEAARTELAEPDDADGWIARRRLDEIAAPLRTIDGASPAIQAEAARPSPLTTWLRDEGFLPSQ